MARCKRCVAGESHTFTHGITGYTHHGCRCDECTGPNRAYQRAYRERNRDSINALLRVGKRRRRRENPEKYREVARREREKYGPEMYRRSTRSWQRRNLEYVRVKHREFIDAKRAIPVIRKWDAWLPTEDAVVADPSLTITEAAYLLGRTYQATARRRTDVKRRAS